jgi:hypothetical protein
VLPSPRKIKEERKSEEAIKFLQGVCILFFFPFWNRGEFTVLNVRDLFLSDKNINSELDKI